METKTNEEVLDTFYRYNKEIRVLVKALKNDLNRGEIYKGNTFILESLIEVMGKYKPGYKDSISEKVYELAKEHYKGNQDVVKKAKEFETRFINLYFNYLGLRDLNMNLESSLKDANDYLSNDIMDKTMEYARKILKYIDEYFIYVLEPLGNDIKEGETN